MPLKCGVAQRSHSIKDKLVELCLPNWLGVGRDFMVDFYGKRRYNIAHYEYGLNRKRATFIKQHFSNTMEILPAVPFAIYVFYSLKNSYYIGLFIGI